MILIKYGNNSIYISIDIYIYIYNKISLTVMDQPISLNET